MTNEGKVIYLTGAPASGKTTLARYLSQFYGNLLRVDFGELLLAEKAKKNKGLDYRELRKKSAKIISVKDVENADRMLISYINSQRKKSNLIIDSHPVTKEDFGFRITSFSEKNLLMARIDMIVVLFCSPELTMKRISLKPEGRPSVSRDEATHHRALQDSVAINYSILSGCPLFFIESNKPVKKLADLVANLCKQSGIALIKTGEKPKINI